ncbi:hypothetical protein DOTSEDRAFT_33752 [Dothistroma septosporum NZE10]|uniref:Uncharacterized protein n=1 Tax=Dothistroma septosporum (strain NZE10 / CBS 128990) TaxID=675120 RepID=N1PP73_DOTSN|nr:hypothetical protein DOTSEDRAFT_33752 [Dothistroma septosporum NZE10]
MLLSGGRPSPHDGSTPVIEDDSNEPHSSTCSTPCPGSPVATSPTDSESTQQRLSRTQATLGDSEVPDWPRNSTKYAEAVPTTKQERDLKEPITSLRQKLEASTALINRLHLRNEVIRLENVLDGKRLQEARSEQRDATEKAQAATGDGRKTKVVLGSVLGFLLLVLSGYVNWALFYSPEVSYVRQRRRAVLGL